MRIQQLEYLENRWNGLFQRSSQTIVHQSTLFIASQERIRKRIWSAALYRSKLGVTLTDEGRAFINYARNILDQVNLLDERFRKDTARKHTVYPLNLHAFVVHAFVELVKRIGEDEFQFTLRETQTQECLGRYSNLQKWISVIYLNDFNKTVLQRLISEKDLQFIPLFEANPTSLSDGTTHWHKGPYHFGDLENYTYLSYEQGETNSFYFSEEI